MYFSHYRISIVGIELEETINEMMNKKVINTYLSDVIRKEFDKSMAYTLKKMVKNKPIIKGKLKNYKNCDNVWMFYIASPEIKVTSYSFPIQTNNLLKIIACDDKLLTETCSRKNC